MIASTYRLQLHAKFGFKDAAAIVEYLDALGITHAYASPYLTAQKGSTHGYDLVDPKHLNPELGTEDDYRAWTESLAARKMGHIVDFVPNHMAATPANAWWRDVLENGQASVFADHFDIEWRSPKEGLRGKVLLPILGAQYGEVLEKGELVLVREIGSFAIRYWERSLPVDPATIGPLLERTAAKLDLAEDDPRRQDLESIATGLLRLVPATVKIRAREKEVLKRRLAVLARDPMIANAIDAEVARMNGAPGDPRSFDDLDALLVEQNYRLAYWRVASDEINYRRFFEVNDLAAIRMEDPRVFADMHEKLLALVAEGRVQGVRLDHVDGLYDPAGYFAQLRAALGGRDVWIGAEKILSYGEKLPESWPIEGTTGYDWLAIVNGLLVDPRGEETFTRLYRDLTGDTRTFLEQCRESKRTVLRSSLASELGMLALRLERLATRDRRSRDFTLATLRRALGETIAAFPVYRTYVRPDGTRDATDTQIVTRTIRLARRRNPEMNPSVFDFLKDQLLFDDADPERRELAMKFQQLTGPVTAKGVEDTAFYTYVRFVGLNEVGGAPEHFGTSIAAFHAANAENQRLRPRTMTTTSTHDTKRGEDVRARLAVLAEMPEAFASWLREWEALAKPHVVTLEEDTLAPSPVDRLLFFQTVIGALPFDLDRESFSQRVSEYMVKAAREAKQSTSWLAPDEAYEEALRTFVKSALANDALRESFASKAAAIATYGASNGLAQMLLKIASPGICDNYQGSETWDLRLVDPDNRTPVDYAALRAALASSEKANPAELVESFRDGRIKLQLLARALRTRRDDPALFLEGTYEPILDGDEIVAFARSYGDKRAVCAVTRLPWHATGGGKAPWATGPVWGDRRLAVPSGKWRNVLDGRTLDVPAGGILVRDLFANFPLALLLGA